MISPRVIAVACMAGALSGCGEMITGPDPARDPEAVFEAAWQNFDRHFSMFAYKQIDWQDVYARYRPKVTAATTVEELRVTICDLVSETRSYHASLVTDRKSCGWVGPKYPSNYNRALVTAALRTSRRLTTSHAMEYATLTPRIGYVYIPSFMGDFGDEIDDVLTALDSVDALVIDIRGNGGGNEGNGKKIAGRFITEKRAYRLSRFRNGPGHDDFGPELESTVEPAGRRHFEGPVALLTNRGNGSASEDFLMMMRVIPTVFTVGDTTIGNSSNPLVRELPNGWELRVPQSLQMTPDHYNPEGQGFPPTIPVQNDTTDTFRPVDAILQRAIHELEQRLSATPAAQRSRSWPR